MHILYSKCIKHGEVCQKYIKVHGPDETASFKHRRTVRVAEFWQMPSKIQWECQNAASLCQRRESHQGRKIRMVEDASVRQTGQSRLHASPSQGAGMCKMLKFDGLGLSHMQLLFRCVCMQLILSIILTISSYYHSSFASLNSHSRHCVNMVCGSWCKQVARQPWLASCSHHRHTSGHLQHRSETV